ncbi:MAG TPA: ATP-binding protein [Roseiflexaceae bacterium]|nr:ATP-binding protein [Roseiflexaceae bacterium]
MQAYLQGAWRPYLLRVLSVAIATLVMNYLILDMPPTDVAPLYLLVVLVAATVFGRGPGLLSSVLAFMAFNYFFVSPRYTFHVTYLQDVVRLSTFLVVAIIASGLAGYARAQAEAAARRTAELTALYELSQMISAEVALERSLPLVARTTAELLHVPACSVWLYNGEGRLVEQARFGSEPAGVCRRSDALLQVERRVLGVLRVTHASLQQTFSPSEQKLLDTITAQVVSLLERARLVEETSQVRALAESDRLKSTLLTSVSHDLRTPLAVIKGAVTDLLDPSVTREPAAQLDMLHVVNEEADRLNRLVGNLLTMSRLEAGAVASPQSWQDVGELIHAIVERLRPSLGTRPLTIAVPDELPLAQISAMQFDQVLTNLLENAAKYTPPGTPISVEARLVDGALQIEVRDAGPGIPEHMTDRIFEKFVRGIAPERHADGSGLGLAICKGIVEAHGGRMWVANGEQGGARFIFTIPVAQPLPHAPAMQTQEVGS